MSANSLRQIIIIHHVVATAGHVDRLCYYYYYDHGSMP